MTASRARTAPFYIAAEIGIIMGAPRATTPVTTGIDPSFLESRSTEETVLKVGTTSDVKQLASSISFATGDSKRVVLRAIGASAVNQMVKACAIARGYVASRGVDLVIRPGFQEVEVPDIDNPRQTVKRTAVILVVNVS